MKLNFFKLIISILLCLIVGFLGSIFTSKSVSTWYSTLNKPSFNPPSWVFAPVWTILFILMGISFYLVWNSGNKNINLAILFFIIQLVLNVLWSLFFFGMQSPLYALIDIVFLWIMILLTIIQFYLILPLSAYLMIPYILWVSFAAVLNFILWKLNT